MIIEWNMFWKGRKYIHGCCGQSSGCLGTIQSSQRCPVQRSDCSSPETYSNLQRALKNDYQWQILSKIEKYGKELSDLNEGLIQYVSDGVIGTEFVLNNAHKVINSLRRCNVALKWLVLHTANVKSGMKLVKIYLPYWSAIDLDFEQQRKCQQFRDLILQDSRINISAVFQMLVNTAQFEFVVKEVFHLNMYVISKLINLFFRN